MAEYLDKKLEVDKLQLTRDVMSALVPYYQGAADKTGGQFEAQQYYHNAKQRLLAGQREAAGYRYQGVKTVSDATTAMVAQGGTVNSEMLARLKRDSEMDAIAALYDAKADALTSQYQARTVQREGDQAYRAGVIKMGANLLSTSSFKWKDTPKLPGAAEPVRGIK